MSNCSNTIYVEKVVFPPSSCFALLPKISWTKMNYWKETSGTCLSWSSSGFSNVFHWPMHLHQHQTLLITVIKSRNQISWFILLYSSFPKNLATLFLLSFHINFIAILSISIQISCLDFDKNLFFFNICRRIFNFCEKHIYI